MPDFSRSYYISHGELSLDHSPTYDLVKYVNFLCCSSSTKRNSQQEVLICCHNEKALVMYPLSPPDTSRDLGAAWGTPALPAAPHSAARINKFPVLVMEINKDKRLGLNTFFLSLQEKQNSGWGNQISPHINEVTDMPIARVNVVGD